MCRSARPRMQADTTCTCSVRPRRVVRAAARALAELEQLASRRRGAVILFVLGLAVYALRAVGWPLVGCRDLDEYLYDYVQFLDWHPLLPWSMLFRTPRSEEHTSELQSHVNLVCRLLLEKK